ISWTDPSPREDFTKLGADILFHLHPSISRISAGRKRPFGYDPRHAKNLACMHARKTKHGRLAPVLSYKIALTTHHPAPVAVRWLYNQILIGLFSLVRCSSHISL